jgi:hypothetical protein
MMELAGVTCTGEMRGTGGFHDVVMIFFAWRRWSFVFRLQSVVELTHPPMGLEPATYTSEAVVAQYLHGIASVY